MLKRIRIFRTGHPSFLVLLFAAVVFLASANVTLAAPPAASSGTPGGDKKSPVGTDRLAREGTTLTLSFPSDQNLMAGSFVIIGGEMINLGSGLSCTGSGPYTCTANLKVTKGVPAGDGPVSYSIHAVGPGGTTDEPSSGTTTSDITLDRAVSDDKENGKDTAPGQLKKDDDCLPNAIGKGQSTAPGQEKINGKDTAPGQLKKEKDCPPETDKTTIDKIVDAVKDVIEKIKDTVVALFSPKDKDKEVASNDKENGKDTAPGQLKKDDDCLPNAIGNGQETAPGQLKTNGKDTAPGQLKKEKDCPPTPPTPTPTPDPTPTPPPVIPPVTGDPGTTPPTPTPDPTPTTPPVGGDSGTTPPTPTPTPTPPPAPTPTPTPPATGGDGSATPTTPPSTPTPTPDPTPTTPPPTPPATGGDGSATPPATDGTGTTPTPTPTPTEVAVLPPGSMPPTGGTGGTTTPGSSDLPSDTGTVGGGETPTLPSTPPSLWEQIIDLITPGPAPTEVATAPLTSGSSDSTAGDTSTPGGETTGTGGTTGDGTGTPTPGSGTDTLPPGMGGGGEAIDEEVPTPPPGLVDSFTDAVAGVGTAVTDLIFGPAPGSTVGSLSPETDSPSDTSSGSGTVSTRSVDRDENGQPNSKGEKTFSPLKTMNALAFNGSRAIDVTIDRVAVVLKHPFSATLALAAPLFQIGFMLGALRLGELIRFVPAFFNVGILTVRRKDKRYGIVFDALTGKPLAAAIVSIRNETGSIQRILSNGYGMYAALVPAGKYTLSVEKDGYRFPSKSLFQSLRPERPAYRADAVLEITQPGMINLDIALDRAGALERIPTPLTAFYRSNEKLFRFFADSLYYGGFTVMAILTLIEPSASHLAFLLAYGLMFVFRQLGLARRDWGEVRYKTTKRAAHFASVKLFDSEGALARRTIADEYGRYYLFVEKGDHLLKYECEDSTLHEARSLDKKIAMTEPIGMVTENVRV